MIVDSKFLPRASAWYMETPPYLPLYRKEEREEKKKKTTHIPTLHSDCTFSP